MADRYFVATPISGDRAILEGDEAHHLGRVLRAKPGHLVTLFDGGGVEYEAKVVRVARHEVELGLVARREVDRELPRRISAGVALPKGERQRWLVEKLTEIGVASLVPLVTVRGVAEPAPSVLARLRRGVIEASKQCGRNRLMQIAEPVAVTHYFQSADVAAARLIAHPECPRMADGPDPSTGPTGDPSDWFFAIGPEGGFTDQEVTAAAAAGWQCCSLGPTILRVETAAVALAARIASGSGAWTSRS